MHRFFRRSSARALSVLMKNPVGNCHRRGPSGNNKLNLVPKSEQEVQAAFIFRFRSAQRFFIISEIRRRASGDIRRRRRIPPRPGPLRPLVPWPSRSEIAWFNLSRSSFNSARILSIVTVVSVRKKTARLLNPNGGHKSTTIHDSSLFYNPCLQSAPTWNTHPWQPAGVCASSVSGKALPSAT